MSRTEVLFLEHIKLKCLTSIKVPLVSHGSYLQVEAVYLVTAFVPSETACLANSPGRRSLTEVWISLEVMVDLLL